MIQKFTLLVLAVALSSILHAQVNVVLHMEQKLGDEPFSYELAAQADMGYAFNVTRLQYYVSGIELYHDSTVTPLTDVYLLIDPAVDTDFELGNIAITDLDQIRFSIGVDQAHNHLDPATYPSNHPLAPQDPSMHWGWSGGYRFIALEGQAGPDEQSLAYNYQIHTVGDGNYFTTIIDMDGVLEGDHMTISLEADYTQLFRDIDASGGLLSHASTGASKKLAQNARDFVFTPLLTSGTVEPGIDGTFSISPNPLQNWATVRFDFPAHDELSLIIHDITGRVVHEQSLVDRNGQNILQIDWMPGVYFAKVLSSSRVLGHEKLIVH